MHLLPKHLLPILLILLLHTTPSLSNLSPTSPPTTLHLDNKVDDDTLTSGVHQTTLVEGVVELIPNLDTSEPAEQGEATKANAIGEPSDDSEDDDTEESSEPNEPNDPNDGDSHSGDSPTSTKGSLRRLFSKSPISPLSLPTVTSSYSTQVPANDAEQDSILATMDAALRAEFHVPPNTLNNVPPTPPPVLPSPRLDRRTLYHSLLVTLRATSADSSPADLAAGMAHNSYLSLPTIRLLKSALALATTPGWRSHISMGAAANMFTTAADNSPGSASVANHIARRCIRLDDATPQSPSTSFATPSMQSTVALALAHAYGCNFFNLDNVVVMRVRRIVMERHGLGPDDATLKTSNIVRRAIEVSKGAYHMDSSPPSRKLSDLLQQDLKQQPDDFASKESLQAQLKYEEENPDARADAMGAAFTAMPTVFFVQATNAASAILRSKTSVDLLTAEVSDPGSTNLLVLGHKADPLTLLKNKEDKIRREKERMEREAAESENPNPMFGMGSAPPSAPPNQAPQNFFMGGGFNPNVNSGMNNGNQLPPNNGVGPGSGPGGNGHPHAPPNISGANDPKGSRRFNIFLTRSFSGDSPGIVGAVAPPAVGNLFQQANVRSGMHFMPQFRPPNSSSVVPDSDAVKAFNETEQAQVFFENMRQMNPTTNMNSVKMTQEQLQESMKGWIQSLLDQSVDNPSPTPPDQRTIPQLFASLLKDQKMRGGIAQTLAKAAPALLNPTCMGVQLSIYVPPPLGHKNAGQMPNPNTQQPPGWFKKGLGKSESDDEGEAGEAYVEGEQLNAQEGSDEEDSSAEERKGRAVAAAAAILQREEKGRSPAPTLQRELRGLRQLRSLAVDVPLTAPTDTKRGGLWEAWIRREAGLITYKKNRRALNSALKMCKLVLSGLADNSSLRQLLSVKDITLEMAEVVRVAVEIEATRARGVRLEGKQELVGDEDVMAELVIEGEEEGYCAISIATIQAALNVVCSITAAPGGSAGFDGAGGASGGVRTREEIAALAQDKHEKALTSNVVSAGEIGVTYDMIGGLDEVKELLRESITYPLKFPQFYSEGIAKEAVKGVLLFGPPGTGKTMLAKAVATEGQATFLSIDASSVENKWLGESEKNAKAVFTLARRLAPCVIFMDEVDSLLSSRESSDDSAHGTLTSVKTTMMMEWDGLSSGGGRVVVIGSTNRPFDLDEAVLRRFPRRILVDLPDLNTRQEILEVTLAQNRVAKEVNFTKIADTLDGYTGSDIKEVCREAVVKISHSMASRLDKGEDLGDEQGLRLREITASDLEGAIGKLKKSVNDKSRELVKTYTWNDNYGEIKRKKRAAGSTVSNLFL